MPNKKNDNFEDLYVQHLKIIQGIKFTRRQIDVMACIVSGWDVKSVAAHLSISPSTVETHIDVIVQKLGSGGRNSIINFVEKSGKEKEIRLYYQLLKNDADFSQNDQSFCLSQKFSASGLIQELPSASGMKILAVGLLTFVVVLLGLLAWKIEFPTLRNEKLDSAGRSDLSLPNNAILLNRLKLLNEIEDNFKDQKGIKVVGIVGIGGAGKTTLARQYANSQNASIVWEINAESKESIVNCLEDLAYALSRTNEDRKQLTEIKELKNFKEKEIKINLFLQRMSKGYPNWFLIYDNVTTLGAVQRYLPHDSNIWGEGKILMTTRDCNMECNNLIGDKCCVYIGELKENEKLELFKKIIFKKHPYKAGYKEEKKMSEFLSQIPPFPLDISLAGFYINTTQASYEDYLKNIKAFSDEFEETQLTILKGSGRYLNTRYGIIVVSLNNIIHENQHFQDLVLMLSLINSQNIPLSLLRSLKDNVIEEDFLCHLKKHSFISLEPTNRKEISSISLHKNIQQLMLVYAKNAFKVSKGDKKIADLINFLYRHMSSISDNDDILQMKKLAIHIESLLNHKELLENHQIADLSGKLGYFYVYLGDLVKAKSLLENSWSMAKTCYGQEHLKTLCVMKHLGFCYKLWGQYERARVLLEQCCRIYKEKYRVESIDRAEASVYLGVLYTALGLYQEAKQSLEEGFQVFEGALGSNHMYVALTLVHLGKLYQQMGLYKGSVDKLEKAIAIFKNQQIDREVYIAFAMVALGSAYGHLGEYHKGLDICKRALKNLQNHYTKNHKEVGNAFIYIGNLYRRLGEYDQALYYLKQGNRIYRAHFGASHPETAWADIHLGNIFMLLKRFSEAKKLIQPAIAVYQKTFGEHHIKTGWALVYLGNLYKELKEYDQSISFLQSGLEIFTNYFAQDHIDTAWIYRALGDISLERGELAKAEEMLTQAFLINQESQNPEIFFSLESLALLNLEKATNALKVGSSIESGRFKKQAQHYLAQAVPYLKTHFSQESHHRQRIQVLSERLEAKLPLK